MTTQREARKNKFRVKNESWSENYQRKKMNQRIEGILQMFRESSGSRLFGDSTKNQNRTAFSSLQFGEIEKAINLKTRKSKFHELITKTMNDICE